MASSIYDKSNLNIPLLYINGSTMPYDPIIGSGNPSRDYVEKSEQLVRSTRNAEGQVIAQKINRRLNKFDNLRWPLLTAAQVKWLKNQIAKFECQLSYWDSEYGHYITRMYYWGDFEATPCEWETSGNIKRPTMYKDVKCNLIDMGY